MIKKTDDFFIIETKNTGYYFRVTESGHLEHIYYGKNCNIDGNIEAIIAKCQYIPGNLINYSKEYNKTALEDMCLEMSSYGKGDIREPFVEIIHNDGSITCYFLYKDYEIFKIKKSLEKMPSSYDNTNQTESLIIKLYDSQYDIELELCYSCFEDCDVITRSAKITNGNKGKIIIKRLLSTQVDFDDYDYEMVTFNGTWINEMNRNTHRLSPGKVVNYSMTGTSSNRSNPFVIIKRPDTNERNGECYGFNLIYSGNHYEAAETSSFGKIRFVNGINPSNFSYTLECLEEFEAPESVMTYSSMGLNDMSHNMHSFVREHIVRGEWKYKERPVLLNSWEAAYFDFNESRLLKMAKAGKEVGIELFVMDDGWFGERNDDTKSLGDWEVNLKKLPNGLSGICQKIENLGMKFGIWIEPEMVNENSNLYRQHSDWAVRLKDSPHSEGRNQMILDLTNKEVRDYLVESICKILSGANISYVKWDMNRIFSDVYSNYLDTYRQEEFYHRYVLGLYEILDQVTKKFPHILFEGCASGGNRFDLGMLCYMPQIWASDNTDAISRCNIQTGYSYGYPMSVLSAHVSGSPNHQTLRETSLDTRFNVACFGILGYECNIGEMKKEELDEIKDQISFYKDHRKLLQFGDYYRIENGRHDNFVKGLYQWMCVDKDKNKGIGLFLQEMCVPNHGFAKFTTMGLEETKEYHFYNIQRKHNIKEFGDLINTVAPFHIKKDSIVHNVIAKTIKLDGEKEDYIVSGSVLNNIGVKLKAGYTGTGYDDQVRFNKDFVSRIYIIEGIKENE